MQFRFAPRKKPRKVAAFFVSRNPFKPELTRTISMGLLFQPVQHIDAQRGGQIAVSRTAVVDFCQKRRKAHLACVRNGAKFVPEGIFKGDAGTMAVEGGGMFAYQDCSFRNGFNRLSL